MNKIKVLDSPQGHLYELLIIECQCGFHIGLDSTYLDQVGEITLPCPACKIDISTYLIPEGKS